MTEDALSSGGLKPIGWYEISIPVRGCRLSIENIKDVYRDLSLINKKFGEELIAKLQRDPNLTDDEWRRKREFLLDNAFRLTVTVNGSRDEQLYGEFIDVFDDPNLPKPIKSIFFTNATAFKRNANDNHPINRFSAFLDFGKPDIFDPRPLVSAETPNDGHVLVIAQDITFFNAVQKAVEKKITTRKTWYGAIHRNFAYDIGIWLIALPVSLYFSAYQMNELIPENSAFQLFRWPLFFYFVGLSLMIYRALTAYAKWAFPVNVLEENKDSALKHRLALGAFLTWLFFEVASTLPGIVVN